MSENKNLNIWHELEADFNEHGEHLHALPVTLEEIDLAEKDLRVTFSDSYKLFLQKYGGAMINGDFLYGMSYQDYMDANIWSVVHNTKFYKEKQKWTDIDDWYIVSDDGRGNPIGINKRGEVWLSDHDSNFEQVKLADSFEEFIHKLLTDTLYD